MNYIQDDAIIHNNLQDGVIINNNKQDGVILDHNNQDVAIMNNNKQDDAIINCNEMDDASFDNYSQELLQIANIDRKTQLKLQCVCGFPVFNSRRKWPKFVFIFLSLLYSDLSLCEFGRHNFM